MKNMGYPDRPVDSIKEDLFNVEVYVNALCSFIKNCETPMTISIQGDWGSGKTSMMNMMKANLQGTVWPIWFNTWQFSQFDMGNSLAFSMMDVILKGLDCDLALRNKIISGLLGFGKRVVKKVSDHTLGSDVTSVISGALDPSAEIDFASEIMELKQKFIDAVRKKLDKEHRDRVVIFVDDLDRLQPAKAVELLEVLKLFLDCDRCVFVLAVDYEVVTSGIRQKFGNDVSVEKGRSFFDKIIQLPFKMPVASYDIRKYVKNMMERINISTDDKEVTLFYNLIQTSVGFNPRSMKRLFNTYELLDIVTKATVKGIDDSVRKRILFGIICMQMCFEGLYLYLASTRVDDDIFAVLLDETSSDKTLKDIYGLSEEEEITEEIRKAKVFLPYFVSSLQIDDDLAVSDKELLNFKSILKCSLVTSVNAGTSDNVDSDSKEWDYRYKNKALAKETADKLKSIADFSIWMPRKKRSGIKISDVSGYYRWRTSVGFNCTLEYYLSRENDYIICVSVMITLNNGKGQEQMFFDTFGSNPLKLGISPSKDEWGRYVYSDVLRLNASDQSSADQIASIIKNAYALINEKIEGGSKK